MNGRHASRLRFVVSVLLLAAVSAALHDAFAVEAAEQKVMRVGFVGPTSASTAPSDLASFWERLRELGWREGDNLFVERRWAEGRIERLPALMEEVIHRHVDVLVTHTTPAAVAAKKATSTIPIVVAAMGDPIGNGLAVSLAHPGSNASDRVRPLCGREPSAARPWKTGDV
jgi:putative ABC transport system substrate-binding protein